MEKPQSDADDDPLGKRFVHCQPQVGPEPGMAGDHECELKHGAGGVGAVGHGVAGAAEPVEERA